MCLSVLLLLNLNVMSYLNVLRTVNSEMKNVKESLVVKLMGCLKLGFNFHFVRKKSKSQIARFQNALAVLHGSSLAINSSGVKAEMNTFLSLIVLTILESRNSDMI